MTIDNGYVDEYKKVGGLYYSPSRAKQIFELASSNSKRHQVMLRVVSYSNGVKGVGGQLEYITREGELEAYHSDGTIVQGKDTNKQLIEDWKEWFGEDRGKFKSRDAMHMIISLPKHYTKEDIEKLSADFGKQALSNYDFVRVVHMDTKNPHCHYLVNTFGYDDKRLRTNRTKLDKWRSIVKDVAKEHGIYLDDSRAYMRGVAPQRKKLIRDKIVERTGEESSKSRSAFNRATDKIRSDKFTDKYGDYLRAKTSDYKAEVISLAKRLQLLKLPQSAQVANIFTNYSKKLPVPKSQGEIAISVVQKIHEKHVEANKSQSKDYEPDI